MSGHNNHAPAIGIDLGTAYSCVAVWMNDRIEIIPNDHGNRTTASCVAFSNHPKHAEQSHRLVGDAAKHQASKNTHNTIFDAKRLIGMRFTDHKVQADMKLWPFKVRKGHLDAPKIVVTYKGKEKEFLAEEISSMVLHKMKETAEAYIGKSVKDAVITVPAYFHDSQRQATKDAGTIAGLNVIRMINEPTAAAIAYGLDNKATIHGKINVLVFDLGGGTFDVSLLTIEKGGIFQVKAVCGDTHLGGGDFDNRLVDHCVHEFKRRHHKDLSGDHRAMGKLRSACEKAKRILSSTTHASIELDGLHEGIDFSLNISREKFENLNLDLFHKCIHTLDTCLSHAKVKKPWVHQVILVGGSTRIPKVQHMLKEYFNGKDLCKSLNVDEAVAYGAGVLASKLSGNTHKNLPDVVLHDVTPLSLGVEIRGHRFDIVTHRNTRIPTSKTKTYHTTHDNQTWMNGQVFQGERSKSTDNYLLGDMEIIGIPPAPKGVSRVMKTFEINANGILKVTAVVVSTGKTTKLVVSHKNGRLTKAEIEKMLSDAVKYRAEDKAFKKKALEHNAVEDYIYDVRHKIEEHNVKMRVSPEILKEMKQAIDETSHWLHHHQNATFDELHKKKVHLEHVCKSLFHV